MNSKQSKIQCQTKTYVSSWVISMLRLEEECIESAVTAHIVMELEMIEEICSLLSVKQMKCLSQVTNTYFPQPNRRRYSWFSPQDESRHQIDYDLINKLWLTSVINARSCPGADSDSDHLLIKMKVRLKAIKQKQSSRPCRFNVEK